MTHFVSRRGLKRIAARLLPEAVQRRLRGRFYGYHDARVNLSVEYTADAAGPVLVLDGRIPLPFDERERQELEHHLVGASLEETSGILAFAATCKTFFDVGTATAFYSRLFCACSPAHRAVAYDPSPSQIAIAAARIAHAGSGSRIQLRSSAVGQAPGRAMVAVAENHFASVEAVASGAPQIEVEMTSLDHEVEHLGLEPDLLKIDVEGFEHDVLLGARGLLARRKPPICLELHLGLLERRGVAPRQVVELLQSHGYRFRTYHGRALSAQDVWDSMHAIFRFVAD